MFSSTQEMQLNEAKEVTNEVNEAVDKVQAALNELEGALSDAEEHEDLQLEWGNGVEPNISKLYMAVELVGAKFEQVFTEELL